MTKLDHIFKWLFATLLILILGGVSALPLFWNYDKNIVIAVSSGISVALTGIFHTHKPYKNNDKKDNKDTKKDKEKMGQPQH